MVNYGITEVFAYHFSYLNVYLHVYILETQHPTHTNKRCMKNKSDKSSQSWGAALH